MPALREVQQAVYRELVAGDDGEGKEATSVEADDDAETFDRLVGTRRSRLNRRLPGPRRQQSGMRKLRRDLKT